VIKFKINHDKNDILAISANSGRCWKEYPGQNGSGSLMQISD